MFRKIFAVSCLLALTPVCSPAADPPSLVLKFKEAVTPSGKKPEAKKFRDSLSALAFAAGGRTMFFGGDETVEKEPSLEQLTRQPDGSYGEHESLPVSSFIDLLDTKFDKDDGRMGEIDIEGLAVSEGYLWLVGSHSTNRKQPKEGKSNLARLLEVSEGKNRFLLGRIPLVEDPATGAKLVKKEGQKQAGRVTGDSAEWNLLSVLADDAHFGPYFLAPGQGVKTRLPGKDNGFDIEGLTVVGDHIYLGLRGPVLRGYACILEIRVEGRDDGSLALATVDGATGSPKYRKHFLDLGGAGIRDLHKDADGKGLWILSGPTMALHGPANLVLWNTAFTAMSGGDTLHMGEELNFTLTDLTKIAVKDHPEGIALLPKAEGGAKMVIVCDGVNENHTVNNATDAKADLLPVSP